MNTILKIVFSLVIGLIAMGIAKLVHQNWNINQLSIFGFLVFIVTLILIILIKK